MSPPEAVQDIVAPASISNLGPAFDTMAVAVALYLRVRILEVLPDAPDTIACAFEGALPAGENKVASAFHHARERLGRRAPGVRIVIGSDIPSRSGLGSSAAAVVAGLRVYEAVTAPQPAATWIGLASELEGHPDNAAACVLGGLTLSCQHDDGRVTARAWHWPTALSLVVATPEVQLETTIARRTLPSSVPLGDAVFNLQRALLFVRALETGAYGDLREAMRDRWHQPARTPLVPGLAEVLALDHPAVLGACLSGAGPSVLVLTERRTVEVTQILSDLYDRLGLQVTIRTLSAHQPI